MSRDDYVSMLQSKSFPPGISPNNDEELSFDRHCCELSLGCDTILSIYSISKDHNITSNHRQTWTLSQPMAFVVRTIVEVLIKKQHRELESEQMIGQPNVRSFLVVLMQFFWMHFSQRNIQTVSLVLSIIKFSKMLRF